MKTILYIGDFKASIMDAQCQLVIGNCKIFDALGFKSVLVGNDSKLSCRDNVLKSKRIIDGFDCYNVAFYKRIGEILYASEFHKEVLKIFSQYPELKYVICYGSPAFAIELKKISEWCKNNHVAFLVNCVDLSALSHGNLLQRIAKSIDRHYKEFLISKKAEGIIAVSSNIASFYKKKTQCPIVIIPPLKDTGLLPSPEYNMDQVIKLVYIGIPFPVDGRKVDVASYKDRIDLFIDLVCQVRQETNLFRLDLYGLTKDQYLNVVFRHKDLLKNNDDIIFFHGQIGHEEALNVVGKSDYSVVFRVRNRMTMAGFSSKLVESISCGTPVILTNTSDYLKYLRNGFSCFVLDERNNDASRKALRKALSINKTQINYMKDQCYNSHIFDYRNYINVMQEFFENVTITSK